MALFAVALVDELASGVAPAAAPDIARDLALPAGWIAGGIVTAFYGLVLIEAPLLAWSERVSVRWFSAGSLVVLAAATLGAALAHGPVWLAICLAAYGPAAGCALASAEGVLVEGSPHTRERTMARLTLAASIGDLAVPALLGALALVGLGWRTVFAVAGVVALLLALVHASARALDRRAATGGDEDHEDDATPSVREALRFALRQPALRRWSLAGVLVGLLDEVLVAFAAVHLGALDASARSVALGAWVVGGIVGLTWLERRIEHVAPARVLRVTTCVAALALAALARVHDVWPASILLAVIGTTSSTFHPLVKARAYASLPGRPALVNAVAGALVPLDALAPLVLGAIATQLGGDAAIAVLALAPVGIAWVAWRE